MSLNIDLRIYIEIIYFIIYKKHCNYTDMLPSYSRLCVETVKYGES